MKTCPLCRMEARNDADWCWHCGYSYEEADARSGAASVREPPADDEPNLTDDSPASR
jgi:predicted amidophosphoribosyltransferase